MKNRYGVPLTVILISLLVLFVTHRVLFSEAQTTQPGAPPGLGDSMGLSHADQVKAQRDAWLNKRIPHPACPNCFKVEGEFGIHEMVPGTDYIITRDLPDPAPLLPGEVRPDRHSETGEPLWYKGNQAFVGPTDEAPMSASLPIPLIQVKWVLYRHRDELSKIEDVHGVRIGEKGILVSLSSEKRANRRLIPDSLEGVPVYVEEEDGVTILN